MPSRSTIEGRHSVPRPHLNDVPSPIVHVTEVTFAVNEIPPALIDAGPQLVRDGLSTHNHTGIPTAVITSGSSGVRPISTGFNCNRAITNSERRICASDELAALDREMAEAYRALNQIAINRRALLTAEQSACRCATPAPTTRAWRA